MTAYEVPDHHEITRYCPEYRVHHGSSIDEDAIRYQAFVPRPRDNNRLSVSWLETFSGCPMIALHCIRSFFGKVFGLEEDGRFVVLNVRDVKEVIRAARNIPLVVSDPTPEDPSHVQVAGFEIDKVQVATDLATLANEYGRLAPGKTAP